MQITEIITRYLIYKTGHSFTFYVNMLLNFESLLKLHNHFIFQFHQSIFITLYRKITCIYTGILLKKGILNSSLKILNLSIHLQCKYRLDENKTYPCFLLCVPSLRSGPLL